MLRLAHALNLHRDGSGLSFPPYEAELRRRLWWQIIVLDVRAVEDRGTDPLIMPDSYTTQLLTNIDDDAFGPDSTVPLVPAVGPTDVTFCLCTAMSSGIFLYVCDPSGRFSAGARAGPLSYPQSEEDLMKHVQQLESLFLTDVRPDHMPSMIAATTLRIIVLKLWLSVQYPLQVRASPVPGHARISHEDMLRTAVAVMELCDGLADHGLASQRFGWWSCTYVQWHPLAVALAELCTRKYTAGHLMIGNNRRLTTRQKLKGSFRSELGVSWTKFCRSGVNALQTPSVGPCGVRFASSSGRPRPPVSSRP